MDATSLLVGLFAGSFGLAYLIYGKKRGRRVMMWSGALLCAYPFLIDNHALLIVTGITFILLPIFLHQ